MIRELPRSTRKESSAASDVYKRQIDLVSTSDEYLFSKKDSSKIYSVKIVTKKSLADKFTGSAAKIMNMVTNRFHFMS